jgi:AcrR family transcriptional regulator
MSSRETDTRVRIIQAAWELMEKRPTQEISVSSIAKAAGISRQAVYLHFSSRTELLIAAMKYVDEVKGFDARIAQLDEVKTGVELIDVLLDIWGNYIPEIYGLAKVFLRMRDADEAIAAAWDANMARLRDVCQRIAEALKRDDVLVASWSKNRAAEMLWTMLSVGNWEQLTQVCGWSHEQYIASMKTLIKNVFIVKSRL